LYRSASWSSPFTTQVAFETLVGQSWGDSRVIVELYPGTLSVAASTGAVPVFHPSAASEPTFSMTDPADGVPPGCKMVLNHCLQLARPL
jgi:hypothetical protein